MIPNRTASVSSATVRPPNPAGSDSVTPPDGWLAVSLSSSAAGEPFARLRCARLMAADVRSTAMSQAAFLELLSSRAANQFDCLFAEDLNLPPTVGLAHVVADSGGNGVLEHGHGVLPRESVAVRIVRRYGAGAVQPPVPGTCDRRLVNRRRGAGGLLKAAGIAHRNEEPNVLDTHTSVNEPDALG